MKARPRLLVVATHPIQYQAPLFRKLAGRDEVELSVLFAQIPDATQQGVGFDTEFEWDIPLLDGYTWRKAPVSGGRGGLKGFFAARIAHPLALLRELDPDVLLVSGWNAWPLVQMVVAARCRRIPVLMRGDSNALRTRPWAARLAHRLLLGQCAGFLVTGKANRDFYRNYGIADRDMFDTSHFVDNDRFVAAASEWADRREELRAAWGIPGGAVCFCYAGKLEPKKRIMDLLAALDVAVSRRPGRLHLLVVGSGELLEQARSYVSARGLPVTFAGFLNQSEMPKAYVAADCLVLPSDFGETWGLVVNEAMACGRPALVSDRVGCGPDLVVPGVTGAIFPFGNVESLAAAMLELADNPGHLESMGTRARELILGKYTVENAVLGTIAAVRHVLRNT